MNSKPVNFTKHESFLDFNSFFPPQLRKMSPKVTGPQRDFQPFLKKRKSPQSDLDCSKPVDVSKTCCKISIIPEYIISFQKMATLDLSYNLIEVIPGFLSSPPFLHTIILKHNRIRIIADDFFLKKNFVLKILDLSFNSLSFLSPKIKNLAALEFLNIESNDFQKLPLTLQSLGSLKELGLEWNIYTEFSKSGESSMKNLELTRFLKVLAAFQSEKKQKEISFPEYSQTLARLIRNPRPLQRDPSPEMNGIHLYAQCSNALENKHIGILRHLVGIGKSLLKEKIISKGNIRKDKKTIGSKLLKESVEINDMRLTLCLLVAGAKSNRENKLIFKAISKNNPGMVDLLLKYGMNPNENNKEKNNETPLIYAVQKYSDTPLSSLKIIQNLMKYGANPVIRDVSNKSSIHHAVRLGEIYLFSILTRALSKEQLDQLVEEDFSMSFDSLLHLATISNNIEMVKHIAIVRPMDCFLENKKGQIPMETVPKCFLTSRKIMISSMKINLKRVIEEAKQKGENESENGSFLLKREPQSKGFGSELRWNEMIGSQRTIQKKGKDASFQMEKAAKKRRVPLVASFSNLKFLKPRKGIDQSFFKMSFPLSPKLNGTLKLEKKESSGKRESIKILRMNEPKEERGNPRKMARKDKRGKNKKIGDQRAKTEAVNNDNMEDFSSIDERSSSDEEDAQNRGIRGFTTSRSPERSTGPVLTSFDQSSLAQHCLSSPRSLGDRLFSSKSLKGTRVVSNTIRMLTDSSHDKNKSSFLRTHHCYRIIEKFLASPNILDWSFEIGRVSKAQTSFEEYFGSKEADRPISPFKTRFLKSFVFLVDMHCQMSVIQQSIGYAFAGLERESWLLSYWNEFPQLFSTEKDQTAKKKDFEVESYNCILRVFYSVLKKLNAEAISKDVRHFVFFLTGLNLLRSSTGIEAEELLESLLLEPGQRETKRLWAFELLESLEGIKNTRKTRNDFENVLKTLLRWTSARRGPSSSFLASQKETKKKETGSSKNQINQISSRNSMLSGSKAKTIERPLMKNRSSIILDPYPENLERRNQPVQGPFPVS